MISLGVASPAAIFSTIGTSVSGSASVIGRPLAARKRSTARKAQRFIAVGERVIASQVLNQNGGLLDQGRIGIVVAEPSARRCKRRIGQGNARQPSDLIRGRPEYLRRNAAVVAERDVENPGHFRVAGYCAKRRSVSSCFFIAARRSRRCSSGVPGSPDFISGFSVVFVGALGACGFIADTLLHPGSTPPEIRAGERTGGPAVGQFYIQIIGNNRIQPEEQAA